MRREKLNQVYQKGVIVKMYGKNKDSLESHMNSKSLDYSKRSHEDVEIYLEDNKQYEIFIKWIEEINFKFGSCDPLKPIYTGGIFNV